MKQILFPVGRLISGSVSEPDPSKDDDGKPKFDAAGGPLSTIWFIVAIPKTKVRIEEESFISPITGQPVFWGKQLLDVAIEEDPTMHLIPTYSRKFRDGDSAVPDAKGKIINTKANYPGNWVFTFSSSTKVAPPKLVNSNGSATIPSTEFLTGYYVQVFAEVKSNKPSKTPGLYVNPIAVALAYKGEVIVVERDISGAGFGGGAMPVGATVIQPAVAAFGAPAPAPAPLQVTPNPSFMTPPPPVAAAPAPVKQMTAKAGGSAYEAFIQQGWTDDAMRAEGYLV